MKTACTKALSPRPGKLPSVSNALGDPLRQRIDAGVLRRGKTGRQVLQWIDRKRMVAIIDRAGGYIGHHA